jgi:hypothetical protein
MRSHALFIAIIVALAISVATVAARRSDRSVCPLSRPRHLSHSIAECYSLNSSTTSTATLIPSVATVKLAARAMVLEATHVVPRPAPLVVTETHFAALRLFQFAT